MIMMMMITTAYLGLTTYEEILILSPFYKWGNWGTEKASPLPQVEQQRPLLSQHVEQMCPTASLNRKKEERKKDSKTQKLAFIQQDFFEPSWCWSFRGRNRSSSCPQWTHSSSITEHQSGENLRDAVQTGTRGGEAKHLRRKREHTPLPTYKNNIKYTSWQFNTGPWQLQPSTCYRKFVAGCFPRQGSMSLPPSAGGELQR